MQRLALPRARRPEAAALGSPPVVEDVLVMAQEGLLGADHQEAHDVVADAGEFLHLGLGEVGRRDALEALLVGLLTGMS